ncbi:MAG: hypothetical protein IJX25_02300 [Clostridia bacterium]|nr:hypothetical protein [Clostridia bacterium]MBQ8792187.1 hypothetical protein [Clostridia bacterium]
MIIIKDKKDSINKIKQMGLNHFPQDVFEVSDIEGIEDFFNDFPADEYVLRSTNKTNGNFFYVKDLSQAKEKLPLFEDEVTISVSMRGYQEDIVLLGDITVKRDGMSEMVDITARDDEEANHRNIYENPKYNLHASLESDKLWAIPGFSKLMRYISDHELYNVIIEFVVYDCKVGTCKDNVVIIEIRTGY